MNNWEFIEANKLYLNITDGTHDSPKATDTGYYLVTSKNIKGGVLDLTSANLISENDYNNIIKRSKVDQWDVIISMIGEYCGYTYIEKNDNVKYAIKNVGLFKTNSKLEANWLKYYLLSDYGKYYINQSKSGSSQPYLSLGALRNFPILNPPLNIKKSIVAVLSALDDKIEVNNKINAELEAMAKTLYDYWFVQFEFPTSDTEALEVTDNIASTSKATKGYKSAGGKMVYNSTLKREIPEGWEVKTLEEIIEVKDGTHDSPKYISGEGYPLVTSKNLKKSGIDFSETNKISKIDFDLINQRSEVNTGDILFSMIGNIGTIYKVEEKEISFAIKNVALFKTSNNLELKNYLFQYLHSYDMQRYLPNVISGSIQKFVALGSLRNTPILFNKVLIDKFTKESQPIFNKLNNNVKQNQELAQLRDWLLPMLMNGQVTVE